MADISKLKQRRMSNLGEPPSLEAASSNLSAPEIAPAVVAIHTERSERIDGRTLRKTGRTVQLATRVSEDFDLQLRQIAQRDGLKIVEVLERAMAAYTTKEK